MLYNNQKVESSSILTVTIRGIDVIFVPTVADHRVTVRHDVSCTALYRESTVWGDHTWSCHLPVGNGGLVAQIT